MEDTSNHRDKRKCEKEEEQSKKRKLEYKLIEFRLDVDSDGAPLDKPKRWKNDYVAWNVFHLQVEHKHLIGMIEVQKRCEAVFFGINTELFPRSRLKEIPFPDSIMIRNDESTLSAAEKIRQLIREKKTAKVFEFKNQCHQTGTFIEFAFGESDDISNESICLQNS